ncbi:MAG: hypothetical protein ABL883_04380 [Terricaulis sp.]
MTSTATPEDYRTLYRRAFEEFGAMALWNARQHEAPTTGHAMVIARALRRGGNLSARFLAERIEAACRAVD